MSNKNVRIYFDGLMVFCFQDKQADRKYRHCRVGILTLAGGHEVTLEITRKRASYHEETSVYTFPHDQVKHFKHLWLYLSEAGESLPRDSSVSVDQTFDQVFSMGRYYDPKPEPDWDKMRPTLHISTGEFWAASMNNDGIYRLIDVQGLMNLMTPLFNANPTAVKGKLEKASEIFKKSHKEIGKVANVFWTDIAVECDQRLTLAVGDERAPITELFSVNLGAGETIEASLTNMPSYCGSTGSHHLAHQEQTQPDEADSVGDSHRHPGDQAPPNPDEEKEKNRMNYLKKTFHFLHYNDVFKFKPGQKKYVLLQDNSDWIDDRRRKGARPDPPCDCIIC